MKKYEQISHTADLAAVIYGKTIEELFENAAFCMFDMMADLQSVAKEEVVRIEVEAPDLESLLVGWLNELLYAFLDKRILFTTFKVTSNSQACSLQAKVRGQKIDSADRLHTEIKAATYHDLEIKKTEKGYTVTVVFDV